MRSFISRLLRGSRPAPRPEPSPEPAPAPEPAHHQLPRFPPPRPRFPPEFYARALLQYLQQQGTHGTIPYQQMRRLLQRMVDSNGWAPPAWNPISRELTKLLGEKKMYVRGFGKDGRERRCRVFRIPPSISDNTGADAALRGDTGAEYQ